MTISDVTQNMRVSFLKDLVIAGGITMAKKDAKGSIMNIQAGTDMVVVKLDGGRMMPVWNVPVEILQPL